MAGTTADTAAGTVQEETDLARRYGELKEAVERVLQEYDGALEALDGVQYQVIQRRYAREAREELESFGDLVVEGGYHSVGADDPLVALLRALVASGHLSDAKCEELVRGLARRSE